jgi:hypothetical protein
MPRSRFFRSPVYRVITLALGLGGLVAQAWFPTVMAPSLVNTGCAIALVGISLREFWRFRLAHAPEQ